MMIDAVVRAARILQTQPAYTMPLSRLHAQLVHELGEDAGSYRQIYQQLKKRTDSFLIVDSPRILTGTDGWPGGLREAYDSALNHAGLGSCLRVTLTEAPPAPDAADLIAALSTTMAELMAEPSADAALREFIERSAQQASELSRIMLGAAEHPTTHPPDPHPPG